MDQKIKLKQQKKLSNFTIVNINILEKIEILLEFEYMNMLSVSSLLDIINR